LTQVKVHRGNFAKNKCNWPWHGRDADASSERLGPKGWKNAVPDMNMKFEAGVESGPFGVVIPEAPADLAEGAVARAAAHILLVEDDPIIAAAAQGSLRGDGYTVDLVTTARRASAAVAETRYDLIVLDLTLPDCDGPQLLGRWRGAERSTPVIAVTARGGIEDKIKGFDAGADDYIVKPFEMRELLARVRAILRRPGGVLGQVLTLGNVELDSVRRILKIGGKRVNVPRRELAILELLVRNAARVVEREEAMRAAYSADEHVSSNVLDAYFSRLRQRLLTAGADLEIHTVRGVGYMLREAP